MSAGELVSWAWTETAPVHRHRANLLIHIIAVPMFVLGHVLIVGAFALQWWLAVAGVLGIVVSLALQGHGHKLEAQPSNIRRPA
jgi:uncharacterized membrane protein YGL010W